MKFANIEIFKNNSGALSIKSDDDYCSGIVTTPIEVIPTLIKCLQKIYEDNNGSSDILEDGYVD